MTLNEARRILDAVFDVADRIKTLHLTGGGEPFLHNALPELVDSCMAYSERFEKLMLFTNSTVPVSDLLLERLKHHREKILVQISCYGIQKEREAELVRLLKENEIPSKVEKYYGEEQAFGGWVDFGPWERRGRSLDKLEKVFRSCAVTRDMRGNWRTRDGKVHWCSRSQRGMELDLIPDDSSCYVDLFDDTSREEKRDRFLSIARAKNISACDFCSGDQGTDDISKRFQAAEQFEF